MANRKKTIRKIAKALMDTHIVLETHPVVLGHDAYGYARKIYEEYTKDTMNHSEIVNERQSIVRYLVTGRKLKD